MKDYKRLDEKIWDFMKREYSSCDEEDPGEYEIAKENGVDVECNITFKDLMLELVRGYNIYDIIEGLDFRPEQIIVDELNNIIGDEDAFGKFDWKNEDARNSEGFSNWYNSLSDEEKLKIELE